MTETFCANGPCLTMVKTEAFLEKKDKDFKFSATKELYTSKKGQIMYNNYSARKNENFSKIV